MKKAKFLVSHFDASIEKFKVGEVHDLTDETRLCIARGAAVEVDVEEEQPADATAETGVGSDAAEVQVAEPPSDTKPAAKAKK